MKIQLCIPRINYSNFEVEANCFNISTFTIFLISFFVVNINPISTTCNAIVPMLLYFPDIRDQVGLPPKKSVL